MLFMRKNYKVMKENKWVMFKIANSYDYWVLVMIKNIFNYNLVIYYTATVMRSISIGYVFK